MKIACAWPSAERLTQEIREKVGRQFQSSWRSPPWPSGAGALRAPAQQTTPPAAATGAGSGGEHRFSRARRRTKTGPTIRRHRRTRQRPRDRYQNAASGLLISTMDEVKVFEDGVEQKITHFERETRTPLRIGLILDTSNSCAPQLSYEKDAAQQFADVHPEQRRHQEPRSSSKPSTLPVPSSRTSPTIRTC